VVARLAEEEADLHQPLGESISARHDGCFVDGLAGGELVFNWSSTSETQGDRREAGFRDHVAMRLMKMGLDCEAAWAAASLSA
jgi:hypothetical protein